MKSIKTIVFAAILFVPMPIFADVFSDILSAVKKISNADKDIDSTSGDIKGINQNIANQLQGAFKFKVQDSDVEQYKWDGDDATWESALSSSGGSQAFQDAKNKYNNLYKTNDSKNLTNVSLLAKNQYTQSQQLNTAAMAASSTSYGEIATHLKNVKNILSQLDGETSEKMTADLNARLLAELCFIELEILKQQNFQTQLTATSSQVNVNDTSDTADFFKWEKK